MVQKNEKKNKNLLRIILFILFSYAQAYLVEFLIVLPAASDPGSKGGALVTSLLAAAMMMPAIAVVLTRLITKEGFRDHMLHPHLKKGTWRYYLLAWFLPPLFAIAGAVIYFLIFPAQFDWNMTYYLDSLAKTGTIVELSPLRTTILSQMITAVILGPVMNCITCFGEEWGWRGYLLPKLLNAMPMIPAIIVSGVVWGIWHIPTIIAGLNYGTEYEGYPYAGILMMILFCIVIGIFFAYLTIRTGSCIPSIIGHGAINSIASCGVYFTTDGGKLLLGPPVTGVIGMVPFMITAVILIVLLVRNNACAIETTCDTIVEVSSE